MKRGRKKMTVKGAHLGMRHGGKMHHMGRKKGGKKK